MRREASAPNVDARTAAGIRTGYLLSPCYLAVGRLGDLRQEKEGCATGQRCEGAIRMFMRPVDGRTWVQATQVAHTYVSSQTVRAAHVDKHDRHQGDIKIRVLNSGHVCW